MTSGQRLNLGLRPFGLAVGLAFSIGATAPAMAQEWTSVDASSALAHKDAYMRTIEMLDRAGYRITMVDRTFLHRIMVRAEKDNQRREIVVSESTGMILRDVTYGD